ncbi:MAG: ankyrin repeat domain-containing protein [Spirochaetaceae bacterium]|nr:MAG: ankyrin repeat domain-containing protein [Spirochaetaceae bacterium]
MKSTRAPWISLLILVAATVTVVAACQVTSQSSPAQEQWPAMSATTWADMSIPELHDLLEEYQVSAIDADSGETALMTAAKFATDPELIHTLLFAGADLDNRSHNGETALMLAVRHNKNPEIIETFLNTRRFCQPR